MDNAVGNRRGLSLGRVHILPVLMKASEIGREITEFVNQGPFLRGDDTQDVLPNQFFLVNAFVACVLGQRIGN